MNRFFKTIELPTLGLIITSHLIWFGLVMLGDVLPALLRIMLFALNTTLFLSITHEVIHGHPTRNAIVNRLLLLFPLGLVFPYERFRDTHIQHHMTEQLTDPFDDPESWYYPKMYYKGMNRFIRSILTFNNTLLGRMLIGPTISVSKFYYEEIQKIMTNNPLRPYLLRVWGQHLALCLAMIVFISHHSAVPLWQFLVAIYLGLSVLSIRTFLEHQASLEHGERTVIIEKCCPLAFLFLYNNLHFVHHENPSLPWYKLPATYRSFSEEYKMLNNHYIYASYGEIFRKFFLTPKENIAHPFLQDGN